MCGWGYYWGSMTLGPGELGVLGSGCMETEVCKKVKCQKLKLCECLGQCRVPVAAGSRHILRVPR